MRREGRDGVGLGGVVEEWERCCWGATFGGWKSSGADDEGTWPEGSSGVSRPSEPSLGKCNPECRNGVSRMQS